MKVKIRKYPTWYGPVYTVSRIASLLERAGVKVNHDKVDQMAFKYDLSFVGRCHATVAQKFAKYQEKRRVFVKVDPWDTWNLDYTLGCVALPLLKQLRDTGNGAPYVDDEDVPHLPRHKSPANETVQKDLFQDEKLDNMCWENTQARWDWILDEMIYAFEGLVGDSEIVDHKRSQNGFRLFGKYYRALWD